MYPNPNSGNFNIVNLDGKEFSGSIIVTDVLGKIVLTKECNNLNSVEIKLDTQLTKGLYFIQIKNENKESIYTTKFMFN